MTWVYVKLALIVCIIIIITIMILCMLFWQAARNCMVGDSNVVKVVDFGLARYVLDDEYIAAEGEKFPIKWAAPEVITHAVFSTRSDVWSYGEFQEGKEIDRERGRRKSKMIIHC